jgi:hypothetical protein
VNPRHPPNPEVATLSGAEHACTVAKRRMQIFRGSFALRQHNHVIAFQAAALHERSSLLEGNWQDWRLPRDEGAEDQAQKEPRAPSSLAARHAVFHSSMVAFRQSAMIEPCAATASPSEQAATQGQ